MHSSLHALHTLVFPVPGVPVMAIIIWLEKGALSRRLFDQSEAKQSKREPRNEIKAKKRKGYKARASKITHSSRSDERANGMALYK